MTSVRKWGRWLRRTVLGIPTALAALGWTTGAATAASAIPTVQYGTPNAAITGKVIPAMESIAGTIQIVLGATALIAIVSAALVNHFVHDQRAKERAKEMVAAAVVGLLLAVFAPAIVNWFTSL